MGNIFDFIELAFDKIKHTIIGYLERYFWDPIVKHYKITFTVLLVLVMTPLIIGMLM